MKHVVIHTDGACEGNPGPGGWAAVLCHGTSRKEIAGAVPATTNNRMELQAAIEALAALKERCQVDVHTDSAYLKDGITKWVRGWKARGWRTAEKKPVKNEDLWRRLDELASGQDVTWHWLKGHAGHPENERCDQLAVAEIARVRTRYTRQQLSEQLEAFVRRQNPRDGQPGLF